MDNQAEMTLNNTGLGIGITPSANLHVNGNAIVTGQVFIGGSSGSSNLNINGSMGYGFQTVSFNATLEESSTVLADSSSDNITLTLPYAGNVTGRIYAIKKTQVSNTVEIRGGGNAIDDNHHAILSAGNMDSISVVSDGIQWYTLERSGGVTTWSPSLLNLSLWYDSSDNATVLAGASGNVYQWNDKSGNGRHATQGTAGSQPDYNTDTLNGVPIIKFDGNSDYMEFSEFDTAATVVMVAHGARLTDPILSGAAPATFVPAWVVNDNLVAYRSTSDTGLYPSASPGGSDDDETVGVITLDDVGDEVNLYALNGTTASSSQTITSSDTTVNTIGWDFAGGTQYADASLAELIILPSVVDTETRQKIEGYLAWKWGLQNSLPTSHPYKNQAP